MSLPEGQGRANTVNKLTFNSIIIPMHMKRVKSELANGHIIEVKEGYKMLENNLFLRKTIFNFLREKKTHKERRRCCKKE
jgi:hypothetical protein